MAAVISKWRMPEDVRAADGLIGPNAILQLLPALTETFGEAGTRSFLRKARVARVPDGHSMIPETDAARLHRLLRETAADLAPALADRAGTATADYILANRIPKPAQTVLKCLPPGLAARALSRAIAAHAWTFAGSGRFTAVSPWVFEIEANPLVRGEVGPDPLCHWHSAVFTRLYRALVDRTATCRETRCCAQHGVTACRFEFSR